MLHGYPWVCTHSHFHQIITQQTPWRANLENLEMAPWTPIIGQGIHRE